MNEYRYKSIIYNYDDLRKAYRAKQLAIQSAIDCEEYEKACSAADIDVREYLPQIARNEPEQIETGDKRTLTEPRKCGIIKTIRCILRHKIKNRRRNKTMIIVNLTQNPYINSGEYRLHTDDGKPSIYVLHEWYTAAATDENRNEYIIIWRVREDFNADENPDESDACDWDNPAEIIRIDDGANVTDRAKISW